MNAPTIKTVKSSAPTPPGYRSFALPENVVRWRPLWPLPTVQIFLNLDTYELKKRLEDGRLAWVFDIGCGGRRYRTEKRVLAFCVFECAGSKIEGITPTARLTFDRVVELIVGKSRATIRGVELCRMFFCQPKHIHALRREKELEVVPERLPKCGPNSSPRITRDSAVRFLERRRIK